MQALHPDHVRDAIKRGGITKTDLADRTGLNKNSLTGIDHEGWNPRWQTLEKLCNAVTAIKSERA